MHALPKPQVQAQILLKISDPSVKAAIKLQWPDWLVLFQKPKLAENLI